jgi:ubiquinone/menaquinone biosynthesis C-methylase UbiE
VGQLVELVTPLHKRTTRDYLARMNDDKVHCMEVARQYGKDYWDGDRRYGYGGYKYDGRWKPLAETLIKRYGLTNNSSVLDVGCGKGHLLHELRTLLPGIWLTGVDISDYGINDAPESVRGSLLRGQRAESPSTYRCYGDNSFDLVLSINVLHNLKRYELWTALREIERVGKEAYICVESYRDGLEQFNLQCWALTCWAFYDTDEWVSAFNEYGYTGDYEFIFFE